MVVISCSHQEKRIRLSSKREANGFCLFCQLHTNRESESLNPLTEFCIGNETVRQINAAERLPQTCLYIGTH